MFKLPSFSAKNKSHTPDRFLTLDIGTDYVKCLAFESLMTDTSEQKPSQDFSTTSLLNSKLSIIGVGKQSLGYLYTRSGAIVDYEGVKQAVQSSVSEALSKANSKITDVIIGLSGEMTKGLVTTVRLTRPDPALAISEEELSKITSKIQETAFLEASKEVAMMTGNPDLDIDLTNSSISSVKLDGVFVNNPLGLAGEKMEVALFTAFAPSFHVSLLQKLAKELKLKILAISSEMYSLSKSQTLIHKEPNSICIDIGGETTDVGIIFGGGLVATRTLSLGGRHVTRAISECFGLSFTDAEELKLRYSLGTLGSDQVIKVENCIRDVLELWISGIELLFSDFDGVKTFPSKIYLVGGGSSLKDLWLLLEREPWTKNIPFKEPPTFEKISVVDLNFVSDMTGKATTQDDVMPIALSEVYLEI